MTRTELKIKLAESVLPPSDYGIYKNDNSTKIIRDYDYDLAERIINFLTLNGIKISDESET